MENIITIPALEPGAQLKLNPSYAQSPKPNNIDDITNKLEETKKIVDVKISFGNPDNSEDLEEKLYKKTTYKDGTTHTEKITSEFANKEKEENKAIKKQLPKEESLFDLKADSANPHKPLILRKGFSIKDRIKQVNGNLDDSWKKAPLYLGLTKKLQNEIEHHNDMKKMYRSIAFDNVSEITKMLNAGTLTPEVINANDGLAMKMVVATGNIEMARTLFNAGASPYSVDPKQCYSQEISDLVIQERYKMDHPVTSIVRETLGLGLPKARFG